MKLVAPCVFGKAVDQALERAFSEFGNPHANGRNTQVKRKRDVVEADHSDVFRDPLASRAQGFESADRHVIVGGKDSIEMGTGDHQLADRGSP